MYKSIILPLAKEDIHSAILWYNKRRLGLGKKLLYEIRIKIRFIRQNPRAFSIRYDDVRTVVLNVFPYMIHYTIDESSKTIIVSGFFHTSRDPEIWKLR